MRSPRVLLLGLAVLAGSVTAVACTSGSSPAAPTGDPVLVEGQKVYSSNCAGCHGANGQGGYGKKLSGVVTTDYPDIAAQIALIANGKGAMPGFSQKLSAEQIEAVTRYTREVL
ncbi:MAG: cytochrome c [Acidimicrobiia bacterium]|nr:cytochrome c [Acidimicrobiia bacterium]